MYTFWVQSFTEPWHWPITYFWYTLGNCMCSGGFFVPQAHLVYDSKEHVRIQKVLSVGVQIWYPLSFVFSWWGDRGSNTAINGPSLACQWNAIEMAFCWRADDGPTLNAGLVATGDPDKYCIETLYFFLIFQRGGGGWPPIPPLWIRPWGKCLTLCSRMKTWVHAVIQTRSAVIKFWIFIKIQTSYIHIHISSTV